MIAQEKILITGGSGLLGTELKKLLPKAHYSVRKDFNISHLSQIEKYISLHQIELIIHAAAFTSPPLIDQDPEQALDTNIIGTSNIVKACLKQNIKLIYISTDYVFSGDKGNYKENDPVLPVNKYAWSKLGGECAVRQYDNSLIIRTSFGPNEFPYEKAFTDQWTSREPVKTIAKKIVKLLDKNINGVIHLGGQRKTVFKYAQELNPAKNIKEISINEVNFKVPKDTSLDCSKYDNIAK